MKSVSKNRDVPSRHGGRGKGTATTGGRPPNRQKTGSNMLEIQGPRRTWGGNPPPSASTAHTPSDSGLGVTESATWTSGTGDSTPSVTVHEAVAGGWDKTPSSLSGWGKSAPTVAAAGWGEPDSESLTSAWGQKTNLPTETEHPPPPSTEPVKHRHSPPSLDNMTPGVLLSQSTRGPTSTLKDLGTVDSRATRKAYLDNLAKLTNASQLSREHSEVAHKLEMCHKIVIGFSQLNMDGYVPEDENTAKELKLRVEATISKLVDAQLWPVGSPEIAQHKTCENISQQIQDIRGRLEALEDTFKISMDQGLSVPVDGNPSKERHRHVTPEVKGDTSLLSHLERLETCVPDVCSKAAHLCDDAVQNFEAQIEQKLVALCIQSSALEEGELRDHLDLIPGPVLGNVLGEINNLADAFSSFEGKKSDLMDLKNTLAVEISKISVDHDIFRSKNNQLDSVHDALKSDIARVDDNVQKLLSEIKSSKMPPFSLPATSVPQQMRKDIVEDILHVLRPVLLSLRQEFDLAMDSGREKPLEYLMGKLGITIEMIKLIHRSLGQ